ncbi:proton-coupled amino acid transporter-like protein CG1139 [Apis dorsata]|uniref:proton-coupled amino acid transporter-like protein CG1139 n=1 Tax=Apis dorsata TaxID=7462 RepID=UPI0012934467|nr:proton-coupled amino acid transporter-like protein CG1139 [Apis dorsata]
MNEAEKPPENLEVYELSGAQISESEEFFQTQDEQYDLSATQIDEPQVFSQIQDEPYDPYAHRKPAKPVSNFKSLATLIKSVIGTGLFAMPNAFASVGLVIGVAGTILIGLLITGCLHILLKIHRKMCIRLRRPILNYDEVVVATLTTGNKKPWLSSRIATCLVDSSIIMCYIGVGAVYVVFISGIVQEFYDFEGIDHKYIVLILFPFFFVMNMMKYLNDIAIISIIGNLFLFVAAVIAVVYALKDGIGGEWVTINQNVGLYPKFVGTVFFSISSPGIMLEVEHDMKKPWNYTKFTGVLNHGMMHITLFHTFVGVIGYLKFGPDSNGNFIRNFTTNDPATILALVMQALSIYFTYGLQCYMPIIILLDQYIMPGDDDNQPRGKIYLFWNVMIRLVVTFITCILAAIIPKLDLFMAVVGALGTSTLSIIIPAFLYILVHHNNYGTLKWKLIFGLSLLIAVCFITSYVIVVNLTLIIEFFKNR